MGPETLPKWCFRRGETLIFASGAILGPSLGYLGHLGTLRAISFQSSALPVPMLRQVYVFIVKSSVFSGVFVHFRTLGPLRPTMAQDGAPHASSYRASRSHAQTGLCWGGSK